MNYVTQIKFNPHVINLLCLSTFLFGGSLIIGYSEELFHISDICTEYCIKGIFLVLYCDLNSILEKLQITLEMCTKITMWDWEVL